MSDLDLVGPILFARGADERACRISALVLAAANRVPPELKLQDGANVEPVCLLERYGCRAWRYDFALPADSRTSYRLNSSTFPVDTTCSESQRIAYVSCNGQEHKDQTRGLEERNAMWRRLVEEHEARPFSLIVHGGDQLYADEVIEAHPTLSRWAESDLSERARHPFTPDVREVAERFYFERYVSLLRQPELAHLSARIPSIMIWDDHDIIDGWGSRPEPILDSPVGQGLFRAARSMFLLFQCCTTDELNFRQPDTLVSPPSVMQCVRFPHLTVIAPDLRTDRRPSRIMAPASWAALEQSLASADPQDLILLASSVPVLGPRLSWMEWLLVVFPGVQRHQDDLRDQWQSRVHRSEWRRLLESLERRAVSSSNGVVIVSGEIHLATRAEMPLKNGSILHQLVSSGIAHPPPPQLYARALGCLARVGESPLPGQRIQLMPIPGQRSIYTVERNYLVLERRQRVWSAEWELEQSGRAGPMSL